MRWTRLPYFITDDAEGCEGFATIKDDGTVIGCHENKQDAIDQMVAVSIAEDIEPGGERIGTKKKKKIKTMYRAPVAGADKFTTEQEALDRAKEIGCEGTHSMDENGEKIFMPCSTHAVYDSLISDGDETYRNEPAPKKDQIVGSDANKPDSAKGAGGAITFDEKTETALRNKVKDHNEKMTEQDKPRHTRTTLGQLKAVYRRGSGAYSTSHRPGISRAAWSMARVNAFLYLLRNGRPENPAYVTDNDLLPEGHPKSTRSKDLENRQVNLSPPSYMRAAARRGLELNRQGRGGDGLTDKTKQEARDMAAGRVSEDKWIRTAAWIARHLVDLDAPQNSNPQDPGYPGAGLVAHLLWGSGPSKRAAMRTMNYAEGVAERIRAEEDSNRWASVNVHLRKEKGEQVSKVERRVKNDIDFEIRVDEAESDGMRFSGYAAVFNSNSEPLPFTERILPGAFMRSLKSRNEVKLFKNHNMDDVLASTRSKTLILTEDSKGLLAEAVLPKTSAGNDLAVLMQRGDVHSMSFGFSVPPKGDNWSDDGAVRELREIRLHEVSIVTGFPAYQATTASIRALDFLASRTAVDADQLADVMLKLEAGETLPAQEADLLVEVVEKLREQSDEIASSPNLELLKKKIDILYKAV